MVHLFRLLFLFSLVCYALSSCFDEEYVPSDQGDLSFSLDTLRFDTVFTSIGSATRYFKIINHSDQNVIIKSVRLARGDNSSFRINVDGIAANQVSDLPVLAGDSIYVFVEVTVDPNAPLSISPFVITEELIVEDAAGSQKKMTMEAWGQNANYFPSRDAAGHIIGLTCQNGNVIWNDPKPYVIYGLLFIDSCTLVIAPGADIHFHGGLARFEGAIYNDGGLFFLKEGSLQALGTVDQPITFQGDRLEDSFQEEPGQWAGLRFLQGSTNNTIQHSMIKNSAVGVRVDSAQLSMSASVISNTSGIGLVGFSADVTVDNSLIHSNATQSVAFLGGGNYRLRYTTLANYENQGEALYMDNFLCQNQECSEAWINPLNASFQNCIIAGSNDDEITMNDFTNGDISDVFNVHFEHTVMRVAELKKSFDLGALCQSCVEYTTEPLFIDQDIDDYHLDSLSVAHRIALPIDDIRVDIDNKMRDSSSPDAGCYESDF